MDWALLCFGFLRQCSSSSSGSIIYNSGTSSGGGSSVSSSSSRSSNISRKFCHLVDVFGIQQFLAL